MDASLHDRQQSAQIFTWPVRVYYEDTDTAGVVYYANYLRFMERARTEWLRHLGLEQDRIREEQGVVFAVRRAEVDYLLPARFNEQLRVSAHVAQRKRASLTFEQEIRLDDGPGQLLCRGVIKVACLDADTFRPAPIPKIVLAELEHIEC